MVELYYNRKDGDFVTALNRHFQGQIALAGEGVLQRVSMASLAFYQM